MVSEAKNSKRRVRVYINMAEEPFRKGLGQEQSGEHAQAHSGPASAQRGMDRSSICGESRHLHAARPVA